MPWRTATVETERARFVLEAQLSDLSFAELCRRHGISRPTGYKWLERANEQGLTGLADRSRRPHSCAHATGNEVVARVLEIRKRRGWGARKIRRVLENDPDVACVPSVDTIHRILERHGKVEPRTPRRRRTHPSAPPLDPEEPNVTWTADFKANSGPGTGICASPSPCRTATPDSYSNAAACCVSTCRPPCSASATSSGRFGLPQRIRTDNGHPFASNAIARLSKLSVWWVTLGIIPEFIEPGKPQQNPRHERMHRDLKRETALPPRANQRAQQRRFNEFRRIFNFERPHEGLGMDIPSERFRPSPRSYEETSKPLEYPAHFEVRLVSQDSTIRWNSRKVFVSHLLGRQHVGFEQVAEAVWSVYFGPIHLGWLDEADYRIMDVMERKRRRR